jgi:predicted MPP superfamily phosphohydrolase
MKLKADVIFVTGDFVNSKVSEVYPFAEVFTDLKAPMGVFGVTGNHDYYSGDIETVVKEIEQCGIKILRNENLSLERNGEKIHLLGIDDKYSKSVQEYVETGKTEIGAVENLIKGIPEVEKKILLCHKPYYFDDYAKLGMDLVLSGHTHGGQLVFAKFGNIPISFATIISKYVAGRLNCPPEISLITLG